MKEKTNIIETGTVEVKVTANWGTGKAIQMNNYAEPIKKKEKCAYLGCLKNGEILDDVEVAPNVIEKKMVCLQHKGQLVGNITLKSKIEK